MAKVLHMNCVPMLRQVITSCVTRQARFSSRHGLLATEVGLTGDSWAASTFHKVCTARQNRIRSTWVSKRTFYRNVSVASRSPTTVTVEGLSPAICSKVTVEGLSPAICSKRISSSSVHNSPCLHSDLLRQSDNVSRVSSFSGPEHQYPPLDTSPPTRSPQLQLRSRQARNKHIAPHQLQAFSSQNFKAYLSHHLLHTHRTAFGAKQHKTAAHFSTLPMTKADHHISRCRDFLKPAHHSKVVCSSYSTASRIVEASPESVQPYLRLIRMDKPIGTWLLYWPCTWSIALASQPGTLPDFYLLALFGAGAFFMRGAGCIINDMWDKDFDEKVERTKTRPLASGDMTQFQALVFLGSQLSCALAILLQLNLYSVILGAASMGLVVTYPLAKRYTYWPQFILGLTLNWGVLLACSSIQGRVDAPCVCLYTACVFYTIIYDTIYSHQDKYDDLLIGVKSAAIRLGEHTKPVLTVFTAAMAAGMMTSGYLADMTWPYYVAVVLTTGRLAQQVYTTNMDVADQCAHAFRGNFYLGAIMFVGIVLSNYLKQGPVDDTGETVVEEEDGENEFSVTRSEETVTGEVSEPKKDTILFMPR